MPILSTNSILNIEDDLLNTDKVIFPKRGYLDIEKACKRFSYCFMDETFSRDIKVLGMNLFYDIGLDDIALNLRAIRLIYKNILYEIPSINITILKSNIIEDIMYLTIEAIEIDGDIKFKVFLNTLEEYRQIIDRNVTILLFVLSDELLRDNIVYQEDLGDNQTYIYMDSNYHMKEDYMVFTYRNYYAGIRLTEDSDCKTNYLIFS